VASSIDPGSRVSQPSAGYLRAIRALDKLTLWTAWAFAVLVVPLVLANTIEVFMRYVLGRPTDWAMETTVMTYGSLFMLGAAVALQKGAHVRTDMLWEKFSDRTKGLIDSVAYLVFFLPTMAILFYLSFDDFIYAWSIGERSNLTPWQPILWPFRAVVPLSAALLFLQGISELLKSLWAARTGKLLVHHEKIDI
jgi:TRAP-type mannitol/chloroaromatic compound transport system permease small subunit